MKVWSFDNHPLPPSGELILLDTCFALTLTGFDGETERMQECLDFTNNLAKQGIIMVTSIKFNEELRNLLDGSAKNRVEKANEIENHLKNNPNYYPEPVGEINNEVLNKADEIAINYNLRYKDAVHYILANNAGIKNIATVDDDFTKLDDDELVIYTDSHNYSKFNKNNTNNLSNSNENSTSNIPDSN